MTNEIAIDAVFLASDDSNFVTGTELFVDGRAASRVAFGNAQPIHQAPEVFSASGGVERALRI